MDKEAKEKLKEVIDNSEDDDNVLLINNTTCCVIGSLRDIFRNFILASLKQDAIKKLIEELKKL